MVTSPTSKKKGKYDITFKLKVIHWAERHSNRAAGSKFGLNESTIRGWRKSAVAATSLDYDQISTRGVLSLHQPTTPSQISPSKPYPRPSAEFSAILKNPTARHNNRPLPVLRDDHNHATMLDSPSSQETSLDEGETDLARLSCSPSDDGYYEDVCYQEEVIESPSSPPAPIGPQATAMVLPLQKTISHQITSRPYPEIQLPFTVIVCKSVRDHWLQRYGVQRHNEDLDTDTDPQLDVFASHLGLARR